MAPILLVETGVESKQFTPERSINRLIIVCRPEAASLFRGIIRWKY